MQFKGGIFWIVEEIFWYAGVKMPTGPSRAQFAQGFGSPHPGFAVGMALSTAMVEKLAGRWMVTTVFAGLSASSASKTSTISSRLLEYMFE